MRLPLFSFSIASLATLTFGLVAACGGSDGGDGAPDPNATDGGGGGFVVPDGGPQNCTGQSCQKVDCEGGKTTSLSGKVYDPAGKVPLYNAIVYVPNDPGKVADFPEGASCERCGTITGSPIVSTLTDAKGDFKLEGVPAGKIKVVVQIGKWRRMVDVEAKACADTKLTVDQSRLPKKRSEGSIPRIALTTGAEDPLECLLRKMGVDDSEFGVAGGEERVHLFEGGGYDANTAASSFAKGGAFPKAQALWSTTEALKKYDLVLMSCEGKYNTEPEAARTALGAYLDLGGRVFASHFHVNWFGLGPAPLQSLADWGPAIPRKPPASPTAATVNTGFPKGQALKDWLGASGALSGDGTFSLVNARHDVDEVKAGAQSWVSVVNENELGADNKPMVASQYFTFNTPVGAEEAKQCGRGVFSDLHVSSGADANGKTDTAGKPFPSGCEKGELSPQERALEFMLFDLSSCVQSDKTAPSGPR